MSDSSSDPGSRPDIRDARHTPPGDRSFSGSVVRHLAAGAGLVALVALVFWGIGRFQAPTADGPVISAPTETTTGESAATEPTDSGTSAVASPDATSLPEPTPGTPSASPTATAPPAEAERSAISVQVLDATGGDGSAMQAVEQELRDLGYQVVATNRAVRRYERSTLFYTEGHREDALLIREDVPELSVVEEKPDNLSDSVAVHVVVGADHPEA